jgi:LPXTG-motif cell wall-anchored protein
MRILTVMTAAAVLVGASVAPLAGAAAGDPKDVESSTAVPKGSPEDQIVTRRDGSRAVPFVTPYDPATGGAAADDFDWGDAATGAAAAMTVVLLGSAGWIAVRRRRESDVRPAGVPS